MHVAWKRKLGRLDCKYAIASACMGNCISLRFFTNLPKAFGESSVDDPESHCRAFPLSGKPYNEWIDAVSETFLGWHARSSYHLSSRMYSIHVYCEARSREQLTCDKRIKLQSVT
eukprot:6190543-Pleurochrysis_carterae.AAC.2